MGTKGGNSWKFIPVVFASCFLVATLVGCQGETSTPFSIPDPQNCIQTCDGMGAVCGEICGVLCGHCDAPHQCVDGRCECIPDCDPADCEAGDGCGGECDCDSACGNGVLDDGESCDGNCPETCDDNEPCTRDTMTGSPASCDAQCSYIPIETCEAADGCCPQGCESDTDSDCEPRCGNGLVEDGESCDGDCPVECDSTDACVGLQLVGSAETCDVTCEGIPVTACTSNDECCPAGCTQLSDGDCDPLCGNGVVEAGEGCDGNCPTACEPSDECSVASLHGSSASCDASCVQEPITQCSSNDGCCPSGCNQLSDNDCQAVCGNAVVEGSESCDGNCPVDCTSSDACQSVSLVGSDAECSAHCEWTPISQCIAGDGCCPSECNANSDSDCTPQCGNGVVEASEECDGDCATECNSTDACIESVLVGSAETCDGHCETTPVTVCQANDGCCPASCNESNDGDCDPLCGNGVVEGSEGCDGNCPAECLAANECSAGVFQGSSSTCNLECHQEPIVACLSNDGCCAAGCNQVSDNDCDAICGNSVVEETETCDGNCPTTCTPATACEAVALVGSDVECSVHCEVTSVTQCLSNDGCCPTGCYADSDSDCTANCGNAVVEPGELCDGDCPQSCEAPHACSYGAVDGDPATCSAQCVFSDITACVSADGCCPTGCHSNNDSDCSPGCGNGEVEAGELCDGNCPTTCSDSNACTTDTLVGHESTCDVDCVYSDIVLCADDGCCAPGCTNNDDVDCSPTCGNGTTENGELCDGDCPTQCTSQNACFPQTLVGDAVNCTASCVEDEVTQCASDDGCCPAGCSLGTDNDCAAVCGNNLVEGDELCDGNCPTTCSAPNSCESASVVGSEATCDAYCEAAVITQCASGDGCCPTGCVQTTDDDCPSLCGNQIVELGEGCDGNCPTDCWDVFIEPGNDEYTAGLWHGDNLQNPVENTAFGASTTSVTNGGVTISTTDKVLGDGAMVFDGQSYLYALDSPYWHFGPDDFTIDFWIKFSNSAGYQVIAADAQYSGRYSWRLSWSNGSLKFEYSTTGSSYNHSFSQLLEALESSEWTHVALMRHGGEVFFFANGQLVGSPHAIGLDSIADTTSRLHIGAYSAGNNLYQGRLKASLDEFRISTTARWDVSGFDVLTAPYYAKDLSCTTAVMAGDAADCTLTCSFPDTVTCIDNDGCCSSACDFLADSDCVEPEPDITPFFEDSRPVRITVPLQYTMLEEWPLVVLMHGYMNRTYQPYYTDARVWVDQYFKVSNRVDVDGFILLQPTANVNTWDKVYWNGSDWCCDFNDENPDDVGYLRSVVDAAKSRFNVDEDRVYFMGHSNGGFMSYRMACEAADIIAGIMPFGGTTFVDSANCLDTGNVTVLHVHGDDDETIIYEGAGTYPGAVETVERWRVRNECSEDFQPLADIDITSNLSGAETSVQGVDHCGGDTSVQLWTINDGTHSRLYCGSSGCGPGTVFSNDFMEQALEFLFARPKRDLANCGNGTVDEGEECDGNCPTLCDDGHACTTDALIGTAQHCTARCDHTPVDQCCESAADCPTDDVYACENNQCLSTTCPQAWNFLDGSSFEGAGAGYPASDVSAECNGDTLVVQSNGMPHYTFVPVTPNGLQAKTYSWSIPRYPVVAAQTTTIPLLGTVGFAVNGVPFFGPNEAAFPDPYGDPVYNDIMDECLGHSAPQGTYHYHALLVRCLSSGGLDVDPPTNVPSPVIGYAFDGFPIYGPYGCNDAQCSQVVEYVSSWETVGDPTTYAWDANECTKASCSEASGVNLDQCNGHIGPDGAYHYHATSTFPYILGCYKGSP